VAAGSPERLEQYRQKRDFTRTAEPAGESVPATGDADESRFVIQKHAARRLHYDVRFEAAGVLISWAVPKGPSLDPTAKRLAVHVEDHPLDYATFEGTIPGGEYGAGAVIVWDQGTYRMLSDKPMVDAVAQGHVSVWLDGTKLKGGWSLTRTSRPGDPGQEQWIMVKRKDEHADPSRDITAEAPDSAVSDRSLDAVRAEPGGKEWHRGMATWVPPMLAQPLRLPQEGRLLDQGAWEFERKLDGLRCVAVRNGSQMELWSRNHLPFTARFPTIVTALAKVAADNFTLDGELVAWDGPRTSFGLLQRPGPDTRIEYHAFDLMHLLGHDTTGLPLGDRRRLLAQTLEGASETIQVAATLEGDPLELLRQACADGWEGLIAKRVDSTYRQGRSPDWRKLKCTASQEFVIGGWTDPTGKRTGLGAVLVGYYDDAGGLQYAGKVGSGFDERELGDLLGRLTALATPESPFAGSKPPVKGAHWARPEVVIDVAYSEWTSDGRLRHPRFERVREDKSPAEVHREPATNENRPT
jgi:bifunctional non-homologous end joining protein LigD